MPNQLYSYLCTHAHICILEYNSHQSINTFLVRSPLYERNSKEPKPILLSELNKFSTKHSN